MSGGHFEYRQHGIRDTAEQVRAEGRRLLLDAETPAGIAARVFVTARLLQAAGECLHALDLWLSSDTSADDFMAAFDEAEARLRGTLLPDLVAAALQETRGEP